MSIIVVFGVFTVVASRHRAVFAPCLFRLQPLFTIIFGKLMDVLNDPLKLNQQIAQFAYYFLYLGAGAIVLFYGACVRVYHFLPRALTPVVWPSLSAIRNVHRHKRASDFSYSS